MLTKFIIVGILLLIFDIVLFIYRSKVRDYLTPFFKEFGNSIKMFFGAMIDKIKQENGFHILAFFLILLLGILIRLNFLFQPMRFDEAFTFQHFASKPLYIGLSFYEVPNNHLFHTMLVHIIYLIFGNEPWILRLPALIAGILLMPLTYYSARAFFNKNIGLMSMSLVSASSILILFSTSARGYTVFLLFFLILLILSKYLFEKTDRCRWFLFSLSATLGAYTIPIMILPYSGFILFLFASVLIDEDSHSARRKFKHLMGSVITTGVLTLLFYLPVLMVSGVRSLFGNHFLTAEYWSLSSYFGYYFQKLWVQWTTDIPFVLIILLIIGLFLLPWLGKGKSKLKLSILPGMLLASILIVSIFGFLGPARIWLFMLILFIIYSTAGLYYLLIFIVKNIRLALPKVNITVVFAAISIILAFSVIPIILHTRSPYHLDETGTLRDAKQITMILKAELRQGDMILNSNISHAPLHYYFDKLEVPVIYLYEQDIKPDRYWLVVNNKYKQKPEDMLKQNELDLVDGIANVFELVKKFTYSDLYTIERRFVKEVKSLPMNTEGN